jgi:hypothetical protein
MVLNRCNANDAAKYGKAVEGRHNMVCMDYTDADTDFAGHKVSMEDRVVEKALEYWAPLEEIFCQSHHIYHIFALGHFWYKVFLRLHTVDSPRRMIVRRSLSII